MQYIKNKTSDFPTKEAAVKNKRRKGKKKISVVSIIVISCSQHEIQSTLTLSANLSVATIHPTDNTEFLQANELISMIQGLNGIWQVGKIQDRNVIYSAQKYIQDMTYLR